MYTDEFVKQRFDKDHIWIKDNLIYEAICGSQAYGTNNEDSDYDIVGIVMDLHQHLYPQDYGFILGFDEIPKFKNIQYKGENKRIILENGKECEGEWHSLTDFFYLAGIKGSPNLIETLFVRKNLITYSSDLANILRDNRRLFLSMRSYRAFHGYCFGQLNRIKRQMVRWEKEHKCDNSKRKEYFEKVGYDAKMANHSLRLIDNIHQMITENDIDLMRNKDECKAMRKGEWGTFKDFEVYVMERLKDLEKLALKSSLSIVPHSGSLHELLNKMIEEYYGSHSKSQNKIEYISTKDIKKDLDEIKELLKGNSL